MRDGLLTLIAAADEIERRCSHHPGAHAPGALLQDEALHRRATAPSTTSKAHQLVGRHKRGRSETPKGLDLDAIAAAAAAAETCPPLRKRASVGSVDLPTPPLSHPQPAHWQLPQSGHAYAPQWAPGEMHRLWQLQLQHQHQPFANPTPLPFLSLRRNSVDLPLAPETPTPLAASTEAAGAAATLPLRLYGAFAPGCSAGGLSRPLTRRPTLGSSPLLESPTPVSDWWQHSTSALPLPQPAAAGYRRGSFGASDCASCWAAPVPYTHSHTSLASGRWSPAPANAVHPQSALATVRCLRRSTGGAPPGEDAAYSSDAFRKPAAANADTAAVAQRAGDAAGFDTEADALPAPPAPPATRSPPLPPPFPAADGHAAWSCARGACHVWRASHDGNGALPYRFAFATPAVSAQPPPPPPPRQSAVTLHRSAPLLIVEGRVIARTASLPPGGRLATAAGAATPLAAATPGMEASPEMHGWPPAAGPYAYGMTRRRRWTISAPPLAPVPEAEPEAFDGGETFEAWPCSRKPVEQPWQPRAYAYTHPPPSPHPYLSHRHPLPRYHPYHRRVTREGGQAPEAVEGAHGVPLRHPPRRYSYAAPLPPASASLPPLPCFAGPHGTDVPMEQPFAPPAPRYPVPAAGGASAGAAAAGAATAIAAAAPAAFDPALFREAFRRASIEAAAQQQRQQHEQEQAYGSSTDDSGGLSDRSGSSGSSGGSSVNSGGDTGMCLPLVEGSYRRVSGSGSSSAPECSAAAAPPAVALPGFAPGFTPLASPAYAAPPGKPKVAEAGPRPIAVKAVIAGMLEQLQL